MKRIFASPIATTIGVSSPNFQPTVTVAAPFGTPAPIAGGRPPSAILTAAGVTVGTNNNKQETNGTVPNNQQAVIVQPPPPTSTLFSNSNGHYTASAFSSAPSITLIPASPATVNSPINLSGVTVTPTPMPTSSATITGTTLAASAVVMPQNIAITNSTASLPLSENSPSNLSSVTVSLSSSSGGKLLPVSQPLNVPKLPSAVISLSPSPAAVTVIPSSEAAIPISVSQQQVGIITMAQPLRNNGIATNSSVEVRPIRETEEPPESKKPRLEME